MRRLKHSPAPLGPGRMVEQVLMSRTPAISQKMPSGVEGETWVYMGHLVLRRPSTATLSDSNQSYEGTLTTKTLYHGGSNNQVIDVETFLGEKALQNARGLRVSAICSGAIAGAKVLVGSRITFGGQVLLHPTDTALYAIIGVDGQIGGMVAGQDITLQQSFLLDCPILMINGKKSIKLTLYGAAAGMDSASATFTFVSSLYCLGYYF